MKKIEIDYLHTAIARVGLLAKLFEEQSGAVRYGRFSDAVESAKTMKYDEICEEVVCVEGLLAREPDSLSKVWRSVGVERIRATKS